MISVFVWPLCDICGFAWLFRVALVSNCYVYSRSLLSYMLLVVYVILWCMLSMLLFVSGIFDVCYCMHLDSC